MTIALVHHGPRAQAPQPCPPCRTWALDDEAPATEFHRTTGGHLIRFPGLADYEVSPDAGRVACYPVPGTDVDTTAHLFDNQVRPLLLSQQGHLVIHASAVDLEGRAVVFAGASGRGKSTLAAALAQRGHAVLADDGVQLRVGKAGVAVVPGAPALRLWDDTAAALDLGAPRTASRKHLVSMPPPARGPAADRPLHRVYFLGHGQATRVAHAPMSGAEAVVAWVAHSFLLDLADRERLAAHFDQVMRLATTAVAHQLDFPRRFDTLAAVADWVCAQAAEPVS